MNSGEEGGSAAKRNGLDGGYDRGEEIRRKMDVLFGKVCQDLSLQSHDMARSGESPRVKFAR